MSTSETSHMAEEIEVVGNENLSDSLKELMERDNAPREEEIKFWDVKTTPFAIAKDQRGYHVLFGNNRLETFETFEDAEFNALDITWNKIINLMGIIINKINEELKKDE